MSRRLTRWLAPVSAAPVRLVPTLTVLESRLNPVTTLYLDFGIGVGVGNSLISSATDFRNIFGAGLRGDGTGSDLTADLGATGTLEFRPLNYDYDDDGTVTNGDVQALADEVLLIARRAVAPYDIDVQIASATSLANAAATVALNAGDSTGQFDAYNFIGDYVSDAFGGGSVGDNLTADGGHGDGCGCGSCAGVRRRSAADNAGLFGIAAADDLFAQAGNDQDEATLTFADTVFGSTNGTPGTDEFNRNLAHRIAYTAVHEAAHTLTLIHTDGSAVSADERLLSSGDQIRVGSETRETTNVFSRFVLQLQGSGTKNNYNFLRDDTDIGLRDDNRNGTPDFAYVTGTGANDIITITRNGKFPTFANVSVKAFSDSARTALIRTSNYFIDMVNGSEGGILVDGSAGDDEIIVDGDVKAAVTVRGNDGNDRFVLRGQTIPALTGYTALGEAGDDTFVVDFTGGDLPSVSTTFDGGDPTTPTGDTLAFIGGTFATVNYALTGPATGGFTFSTGTSLLYSGLEAVDMTGLTVTDLTFTLSTGGVDVTLEDDGTGGNSFSQLRSTSATPAFVDAQFRNPSSTLTISGSGTDKLTVEALPDFTAGLLIGTAAAPLGTVTFSGPVTLAADRNLSAFATGTISLPNATSDLTLSGTGAMTFNTRRDIVLAAGSSLATAAGNVMMTANRQAASTAGGFVGIDLRGSVSTAGGSVALSGRGGTIGNAQNGVNVTGSGIVSTTGGVVSVAGTGGGSAASANGFGVLVAGGGVIATGGVGGLTVVGVGGVGTGANNYGVCVTDPGSALNGSGTVDITATGGGGATGTAFRVESSGNVSSGGGPLTISADSMVLAGNVRAGSGGTAALTLQPRSAGTRVNLGGADVLTGTPTLGLTAAELGVALASTLTIGRVDSGPMTLSADLTAGVPTLQLVSGAGVTSTAGAGRFATAGGALLVAAGGTFTPARSGTDLTASMVSFTPGSTLGIVIDGTAAGDTVYSQLITSGAINLTGLTLALSGGYIPTAGDTFTVVSGTSVTGTFSGLADGAIVPVNGVNMRVQYSPTDVTLMVTNRAPVGLTAGGPYTLNEGEGLTVTAGAATDPDGDVVSYSWDINGDGTFGDEFGGTATDGGRTLTFTAGQLAFLGLGDGPQSVTATVRASDGSASATATADVTVSNLAPTVTTFNVPDNVVAGSAVASSVSATDPAGSFDPITYAWTATLNGTTVASGSGTSFSFTPTEAGSYTVTLTATDGDGGTDTRSEIVTVDPAPPAPPPPPPPPPPLFVAGPVVVTSVDGTVSVTDSTTGFTRTLMPYPGFGGGLTVASADLNGDGYPEIVTGAGFGGGPHVKVFDGKTLTETASFFAYDPSFNGGVFVAAGGGRIATGAGFGGGPHVRVFDPTGNELSSFFAFAPTFKGGVRVALGDLDADGVPEIAATTGRGASVQVRVFGGTGGLFTSFAPFTLGFTGGAYVAIGGGRIAVSADSGAAPHVKTFDPFGNEQSSFFAYATSFKGGVRVAFADSDADGVVELVTAPGAKGGPHIKAYSFAPFALKSERFDGDPFALTSTGVFVA